jgi:cytochrome P450
LFKVPLIIVQLNKGNERQNAQHPDEMSKARNAVSKAKDVSQIMNLNEIQNVIRESNRLLSVVASISMRKIGEDLTSPDGHSIPKGTIAFIPQHLANHDPETYKNPELFLPDRWNDATKEMMNAHMPFAVGVRSCPGLSLAKVELGHIIPRLIKDYDFDVISAGEPTFFITLKPVGAVLRPRRVTNQQ